MKRRTSKPPNGAFWVAVEGMRPRLSDSGGSAHMEASEAFYRIVELMCPEVDSGTLTIRGDLAIKHTVPDTGSFYPRGHAATIRIATPAQLRALNKLWAGMQKAVDVAHLSGIERGKALLIRLARGDITAKQLNDNTLENKD